MTPAEKLKWGKKYKRYHKKFMKGRTGNTTGADLNNCRQQFMEKNGLEP